ncbi:MAG TPA: hypothetical protein VJ991_03430 [Balneolales bacterium]|nr:hypothetical protein [Balneolales bacterium]
MKNFIGVILILASIGLGFWGYKKYEKSRSEISIGKLELSAQKKDSSHWIIWGAGGLSLVIGISLLASKKR